MIDLYCFHLLQMLMYNVCFSGSGSGSGVIINRFPEKDWADCPFTQGIELVSSDFPKASQIFQDIRTCEQPIFPGPKDFSQDRKTFPRTFPRTELWLLRQFGFFFQFIRDYLNAFRTKKCVWWQVLLATVKNSQSTPLITNGHNSVLGKVFRSWKKW